jgi:hypothetical protein
LSQEHIKELEEARASLVNARRNWTKTVAKPGPTSDVARNFTDYQEAIEAIDAAIKEERKPSRK